MFHNLLSQDREREESGCFAVKKSTFVHPRGILSVFRSAIGSRPASGMSASDWLKTTSLSMVDAFQKANERTISSSYSVDSSGLLLILSFARQSSKRNSSCLLFVKTKEILPHQMDERLFQN